MGTKRATSKATKPDLPPEFEDEPRREISKAYDIVRATDLVDMVDAINEKIIQGWIPIGGTMCDPKVDFFLQPGKEPHPYWQVIIKPSLIPDATLRDLLNG